MNSLDKLLLAVRQQVKDVTAVKDARIRELEEAVIYLKSCKSTGTCRICMKIIDRVLTHSPTHSGPPDAEDANESLPT